MFALLPAAALAVAGAALTERLHYQPAAEGLPKLVALYHRYGLPLPPPDAILVRQMIPVHGEPDDGSPPPCRLAFLVASCDLNRPLSFFDDDADVPFRGVVKLVAPDPSTLPDESSWTGDPELAVRCQARGWTAVAEEVLNRWCRSTAQTPEEYLADRAWAYWVKQIDDPWSDWDAVAKRLRAALADREAPPEEWEWKLIHELEISRPSPAVPGSVDALIEDLIAVRTDRPVRDLFADPRVLRIADRGLDAVPALLAHLADERRIRLRPVPPYIGENGFRVGEVAAIILRELAGEESWGAVIDPDEVRKWWWAARASGEEAYLVAHVFRGKDESAEVNRLILTLIARKYPHRLARICRSTFEHRPDADWGPFLYAVATSNLPSAEKRKLIIEGYAATNLVRCAGGLCTVGTFDPDIRDRLLADILDALSELPDADELAAGWLTADVLQTADFAVWQALSAAVRRAAPEFRQLLLNFQPDSEPHTGVFARWLDFQAAFLDGPSDPDGVGDPRPGAGPQPGDELRCFDVRNVAATQLGRALQVESQPDLTWSADDWAVYRAAVREALHRARLKGVATGAAGRSF